MNHARLSSVLLALGPLLGGCHDMWQQPKYQPLQPSALFPDGASARPLVAGVVSQESPRVESAAETGQAGNRYAASNPLPLTRETLLRGQERYEAFCSPCHGLDGYGDGIVIQRGFPAPPSYHINRLRAAPEGHIFDVITNGYGAMYSYADRVKVRDRWAIAAYIRALQRSQNASIPDVPPFERKILEAGP